MKWQSCVLNSALPARLEGRRSVTKPDVGVDEPAEELEVHEALEHVVDLRVERRHVLQVPPTLPMSLSDMPTQSVAQPMRSCATPAENEPPSTSPALPSRPWP